MNLFPLRIRPLDLVMITRKGNDSVGTNLFAYVKGRMYEEWITVISDFTADAGTDVITLATSAGGVVDYSPELNFLMRFTTTGTLPAGLSTGTNYYAIPVSSNTFKVSATLDGSAVNITDAGTGTHTAVRYSPLTLNTTGDLIGNLTSQIESILRDEIFVERDLEITTKTSSTLIIATGLRSDVDDYYVGAIYHNVGTSVRAIILAYNGTTKEMTLSTADTLSSVGNQIFITNIKGDAKIDKWSFQRAYEGGYVTTGGGRSINSFANAYDLLSEMCFETFTILSTSQGKYKLSLLSGDYTSVATWSNPLKDLQTGDYLVQGGLTPLQNVYTEYVLHYQFNYAKGDYDKAVSVSPSGYTDGFSLSSQQTLCLNAQTNYKINNKWEYSANWIEGSSAEAFLKGIVSWFTKQRTWIRWGGDFGNYIKYEIGDIVLLDLAGYIPDSLNNSAKFLIYGKEISFAKGSPQVIFELIEVE